MYEAVVRMDELGRVYIPKEIREAMGITGKKALLRLKVVELVKVEE